MYNPIGLYSPGSLASMEHKNVSSSDQFVGSSSLDSAGFTGGFPAASSGGSFSVGGVGPKEKPLKIIRGDK